jgi:integrase
MTDANPKREIDQLRARITGDVDDPDDRRDVRFDADRGHLIRMSDNARLVPSEIGPHRHVKILRHCTRMAEHATPPSQFDFDSADIDEEVDVEAALQEHGLLGLAAKYRPAANAIVRWIHETYDNEHTNQDYRTALRSYGRYRYQRDEPPESLDWIPTGTSNDFDPTPSERDLLDFDRHIQPMIKGTRNVRDAALIAVQFEAGLRGGELFDLRVGDVFDAEHTVGLHVDGKEGERTVHLLTSVPYLQQWLGEHPGDDGSWLWSKLDIDERPSYNTFLDYFKRAARRVDIDRTKDVTPTNFRKSNTRWLAQLNWKQYRIEDRQGRERGSEHTARYLAEFGDESNEKAYAALHGKEVETEGADEHGPIPCPRCHRDTPRHEDFCVWCHQALSYDASEAVDEVDEALFESGGQVTDEPDVEFDDLREARRVLEENPALKRALLSD